MSEKKQLNHEELEKVSGGRGDDFSNGYEEYSYAQLANVPIGKIITVFDNYNLEDGAVAKAAFAGKRNDSEGEYYAAIGQTNGYEYKRRKNDSEYIFAVREIIG